MNQLKPVSDIHLSLWGLSLAGPHASMLTYTTSHSYLRRETGLSFLLSLLSDEAGLEHTNEMLL